MDLDVDVDGTLSIYLVYHISVRNSLVIKNYVSFYLLIFIIVISHRNTFSF